MAGSSWTNQLQNLLIIQTGSGATGLFIYNGTPKAGNGPVFWASESTTDPYGNTITPTAGVSGAGQFNAGNTIINVNGTFTYSATPAANNLIASSAPAAGTDGFGNAYLQGGATYFLGVSQWTAIANQSITGGAQIAWYYTTGLTETGWVSGGNLSFAPGVASPTGTPLQYQANGQGLIIGAVNQEPVGVNGYFQLAGQSVNPTQKVGFCNLYADSDGYLRFQSGDASDAVRYDVGAQVFTNTSPQTISSTTAVTITGLSKPVTTGNYYFRGVWRLKQGTTNVTQNIGFSGPTTSFCVWYQRQSEQSGTAATFTSQGKVFVQGSLTTVAIPFNTTSDESYVDFEGYVTFSAAGTFACVAAEGTAGDTWTVQPGCIFMVRPVR